MPVILTFEAEDHDELMGMLRGFMREQSVGAETNVIPLKASAAYTAAEANPPVDRTEVNPKPTLTVDELKAGMTLKETASTTLGDNTRVAAGDNVRFKDDEWHVYATYRGKLVVMNEANVADVVDAAHCTSVPGGEPSSLRPGTAGALLNQPDPNQRPADQAHAIGANPAQPQPITPAEAARLRNIATEAVASGKVEVDAVYAKLNEIGGVSQIDLLTTEGGAKFDTWIMAAQNPNKLGF